MFVYLSREQATPYKSSHTVNLRCPSCRHEGAFTPLNGGVDETWQIMHGDQNPDAHPGHYQAGYRQCPNALCGCLVFYVYTPDGMHTFPPQVIDFDATNLPPQILACLEEAVKCHSASCYRAAALMVRRTLEEMCVERGATGSNLKAKIAALKGTIVISQDLLDAADELRLLGNDAAHIEAQTYDAIEAEEVDVAIELTKELLKAVYQHTSLVARLRALKKAPTTT